MKLILASSSPRRRDLLNQVNIKFELREQQTDESRVNITDPVEKVKVLSELKSYSTALHDSEVILTADTVVSKDGIIYEKPKDLAHAREMIRSLSGATHQVLTGCMLRSQHEEEFIISKTDVTFYELTDEEIDSYLQYGDHLDKAGAYGIQSQGAVLVREIHGDYNTVVGLPLAEVVRALNEWRE
ncbi:Maf family protein [Lacicoccus alkaliphilus]|uniref:dTTP/UTP pyrophosphatase n=1 Tax=Lacicoccus alkaliphilus DSM 16010 TaxID=1123231 RepID=A0A1M7A573_9BACL|nr:Maf family protein [Salinicoccus alkaliphilus]SHL37858.1 septum formation protein [Salinicoccus alkaliphilus DSM 16010]